MRTKVFMIALTFTVTAFTLMGCGAKATSTTGNTGNSDKIADLGPVTISMYKSGAQLSDTEFQTFFVEPLKKKYPNVTLELINDTTGSKSEDLLATGTFPDVVYTSNTSLDKFKRLGITTDLNPLVKKQNTDLTKVKPAIMQSLPLYSDKGELLGLPFSLNYAALWYNKDLFDKYAVPYPTDLMTWDDAGAIARKLTRTDKGTQYLGIDFQDPDRLGGGLSLPLVDPKTGKPVTDSDQWKNVFTFMKSIWDTPGYVNGTKYKYGTTEFMKDKTLAMVVQWADAMVGPLEDLHKNGQPMNFDVVSMPNFKEALGTGREVDIHMLLFSSTSQKRETAFQVMSYILSDEVQSAISKSGRMSVLDKPEIDKVFMSDLESMKGKNIAGILKAKPRVLHAPNEWDKDIVKKRLADAAKDVATGNKDINTALREARDKMEKEMADANSQANAK